MQAKNKILLLLFIVFLCYSNTLRNGFVWDDDEYITKNERIMSLKNIPSLFVPLKTETYRPLRLFTFSIEYSLFGVRPFFYHFDNLLIHLLNVFLLFKILLLIFKDGKLAFFSSLIFGIYPAWNEAIVWAKNRSILLACLFFLAGLYFYIKRRNLLSMSFFILGLLSKEIVIAFPLILTAYAFIFEPGRKKTDLVPFWAINILWIAFLFTLYGGKVGTFTPGAGFFFSLKIMFRFLLILLFPFRFNAEREVSFPGFIFDKEVVLSFIIMILLVWFLYRTKLKNKTLSFVILWLIFNIFPTANPGVVAGRVLAEHRLYIPGIGFSVLIYLIFSRRKEFLYALIPLFFITSFKRNFDWKDPYTFWSKTVKASPDSPRALANLALAEKSRGDMVKAEEYFRKSLELEPYYAPAVNGLFDILTEKGRIKEAEDMLVEALKRFPDKIDFYRVLIGFYTERGKTEEARSLCKNVTALLSLGVGDIDDYLPIGMQTFQLGLLAESEKIFRYAFEKMPWSSYIANNLASLCRAKKDYAEAVRYYEIAIKKQPSNPVYYYNLGNLYDDTEKPVAAISSYKKAIDIAENYGDAWYNLGMVYEKAGNLKEANQCFKMVAKIEPENFEVRKKYE
ncbi:tetratricopeptide repeat protein [bacterium]|nr:tetratricopeptide repeat protein [bacterium]